MNNITKLITPSAPIAICSHCQTRWTWRGDKWTAAIKRERYCNCPKSFGESLEEPFEAQRHDPDCLCGLCGWEDCGRCDGTGTMKLTGFVSHFGGCEAVRNQPMKCTNCYGSGSTSRITRKMRRIAEHIREGRIALDLTQREQARILGMSFSDWNAIIRGRPNDVRAGLNNRTESTETEGKRNW